MPLLVSSKSNTQQTPTCRGCGSRITGSYVRALESDWHAEHFLCTLCRRPIGSAGFVAAGQDVYHPHCHVERFAPRCSFCATAMTGVYIRDSWGNELCSAHLDQYQRCAFCGRLTRERKAESNTSGADPRCDVCSRSAVESERAAVPQFSSVLEWIQRRGLSVPVFPLDLVDRHTLMSESSEPGTSRQLGFTRVSKTVFSDGTVKNEVRCIAGLKGLPEELFCAVIAHELGHAWLRMSKVDSLSQLDEEGFCEMLSFLWLSEEDSQARRFYADRIAENDDPIYGAGFRKVHGLLQTHGFEKITEALRSTGHLPES